MDVRQVLSCTAALFVDFCFTFFNIYIYRPKPYLYKNDHKYPGVNGTDLPVAILYAEIGTKKFNTFHKVLSEKAEEGKLIYVLRHFVAVSLFLVRSIIYSTDCQRK